MRLKLFAPLMIIILGFAVYFNSLQGEFIWDDIGVVRDNLHIRSFSNLGKIFTQSIGAGAGDESHFYRPVVMATYMLNYYWGRLNVTGYHLGNILLHILTVLSFYWLVCLLFQNRPLAFFAAVIFVVHPVHTEAVAYIADRADIMAALFILLSFIFYIKYIGFQSKGKYVLMLFSFAAALFSKENSIIFPGLLLLYHYIFRKKVNFRAYISICVIAVIYLLLRLTLLKSAAGAGTAWVSTIPARLPGFFAAVISYIRLLFFPFGLHMEYGKKLFSVINPRVILGICAAVFLLFYAFRQKDKRQLVSFSLGWFFLTLLPVSNLYPLAFFMSEHWLYLPSMGFCLIIAYLIISFYQRFGCKKAVVLFSLVLIGLFFYLTVNQNNYWSNTENFYKRTLKYAPDSARVYNNLGVVYYGYGKFKEADEHCKKAIELEGNFSNAYSNQGVIYKNMGKYEEAILAYKKAISLDPDYAQAYNNLGVVLRNLGRYQEAIEIYKQALEVDSNYANAYYNLGYAYNELGRKNEAIESFKQAIEYNPYFLDAYNNLGVCYNDIGDIDKSIALFERALENNLYDDVLYSNLAVGYFFKKKYDLARKFFDKAKNLVFINDNLGKALQNYR